VYRYGGGKVGAYPLLGSSLPGSSFIFYPTLGTTKYTGSYGTGSTLSRSSLTGPQSIGSTYTVTYSTSTSAGSNFLAPFTVASSGNSSFQAVIATLTNGNAVVVYSTGSSSPYNLLYAIYTSSGSSVASGTITTFVNSGGATAPAAPYAVCALNGGGFMVLTNPPSSNSTFYKYSATGGTPTTYTTSVNMYYPGICADASDNIYVASCNSIGSAATLYKFLSTSYGTVYVSVGSGSGSGLYGNPKCCITNAGNLAWVAPISTNGVYVGMFNGALTSGIVNTSITANAYNSGAICAASNSSNGGFFCALSYYNGNTIYCYYFNDAGTSNGTGLTVTGGTLVNNYSGIGICLFSGSNSGVYDGSTNSIQVFYPTSSGTINQVIATFSGSSFTFSTPSTTSITFGSGSTASSTVSASPGAGPFNYVLSMNSSYYPILGASGSYTVSGSASATVPSSYQPTYTNGYSLIGIAATTASAGSMGKIIINGTASLNSSYATSSTPSVFNYNPTNGSGFLGNRGYVVNRTVTLQGLE